MIEILKEESLEEREKRKTEGKQQMAVKKQEKEKEGVKKESFLPKNIRQVGEAGEYTKVYFEDYVMTYIKQQAAFAKERENILIFYGDKRKIDGKTYYFVSGALKVEEVNSCLYPILFNQEDWKDINECARQFFPNFAVLGWALLCEGADLELKTRILETQEEFFGEEQPVFMEYMKSEKEERVYLYRRGKMNHQTGHYIYYDKNERMQNYMIHEKDNVEKVEEESVDHAARQFRVVVQEKQEEKKRKRTNLLLYSTAITLAVVVMLIGITLLGNYEKMENMENFLHEMAKDTTQKDHPVNTLDDSLKVIETNNSIVNTELAKQGDGKNSLAQGQAIVSGGREKIQQEQSAKSEDVQSQQDEKNSDGKEIEEGSNTEKEGVDVTANGSEVQMSQNESQKNANASDEKGDAKAQVTTEAEKQDMGSQEADVQINANQTTNSQGPDAQAATRETATSQATNGEITNVQEDEKQIPESQTVETQQSETVEKETIEKNVNANQASEETVASVEYQTYIIKKGDTLEKINRLFYGSENRIKEICEMNKIENQDNIRYGEKIILPY